MLLAAALVTITVGIARSYLGEKYILMRLFRRPLPKLFGDDSFTRNTLRFTWHLLTVAWFGVAAILVSFHSGDSSKGSVLLILGVTFAISALVSVIAGRGRHLSWIAFAVISILCFTNR